jgi:hypothetical protein
MPSQTGNFSTYIALALAAVAAVASAPGHADATFQRLQWLRLISASSGAAALATALSNHPESLLPP